MTQKSFFWNGVSTGDADTWTPGNGYHGSVDDYESPLIDIMFRALWNGENNRGVLYGWRNALAVTGAATPVTIATGGAIIFGLFYDNDAATTLDVPTPNSETRIDRIVVRRNWAAQTARVVRVAGVEGGTAPSLVQSPRTFYDIPLAQVSIDIAGTITLTDEREYAAYSTAPVAGSITNAHVAAGAVDLTLRETRTERMFIGAADMQYPLASSTWEPQYSYAAPSASGSGSASELYTATADNVAFAWNGILPPGFLADYTTVANHQWLAATFRPPVNMAGTTMDIYVWWAEYANTAAAFTWQSTFQAWTPSGTLTYGGALTSTAISGTYVLGDINRSTLKGITGLAGDEMIHYLLIWYNPTNTSDRPKVIGLEAVYTGYVP